MIDRTALPRSRSRPGLALPRLPRRDGESGLRQPIQYALLIVAIGVLTFVLYLYVLPNSQMNAAQARIAELKATKAGLIRQNSELQRQISQYTTMRSIEDRARKLGMGPVQNAVFLKMPAGQEPAAMLALSGNSAAGPAVEQPDQQPFDLGSWIDSLDPAGRLESLKAGVQDLVDRALATLSAGSR
jgi:hypothetical protein